MNEQQLAKILAESTTPIDNEPAIDKEIAMLEQEIRAFTDVLYEALQPLVAFYEQQAQGKDIAMHGLVFPIGSVSIHGRDSVDNIYTLDYLHTTMMLYHQIIQCKV